MKHPSKHQPICTRAHIQIYMHTHTQLYFRLVCVAARMFFFLPFYCSSDLATLHQWNLTSSPSRLTDSNQAAIRREQELRLGQNRVSPFQEPFPPSHTHISPGSFFFFLLVQITSFLFFPGRKRFVENFPKEVINQWVRLQTNVKLYLPTWVFSPPVCFQIAFAANFGLSIYDIQYKLATPVLKVPGQTGNWERSENSWSNYLESTSLKNTTCITHSVFIPYVISCIIKLILQCLDNCLNGIFDSKARKFELMFLSAGTADVWGKISVGTMRRGKIKLFPQVAGKFDS